MSNEADKEETAGHGLEDADNTSANLEKVSPAAKEEGNPSPQTREDHSKEVSAPTLESEEPDPEAEQPDQPEEGGNDAADSVDTSETELKIPEILPLGGAREDSPEQPEDDDEKDDDERVWGNQVGGHVDREEVPVTPAGNAFDVSQISVKKSESVKKTHSGSRRVVAWILGVVAVITLVVVGLYASGILQKIFNPEGAASPKEGARAYYGALLDKDAETLCVLSSPTARGELVAALSKKSAENSDSVEKCTAAAKEAFAQVPDNPAIKLKDMVFAPEKAADAGGTKAILIKDKKGTPLQIMGWQEIDGRWFLAGQQSQQQVMMKYQQSLAAGAKGKK
ncbi:hypothetical protein [Varibaculum cambriense]|uniref:hypothetical protein n=1 Tax=Varibaculum cambriense TaxID=184870 RepID=UPI0003B3143B|nr:hypothetical protein [Varibaculum cambriense]MDU4244387.1 hypothetical protein [Varibaculum cambriense]MDU5316224.1 hypothetical protein [Varibaculum cambriense]